MTTSEPINPNGEVPGTVAPVCAVGSTPNTVGHGFAESLAESKTRADQYKSNDPNTEIPAALLNSADIYTYVQKTGMIFPFNHSIEKKKLKSASYEIDFDGDVYYWESGNSKLQRKEIRNGEKFILSSNAIVFVCPLTTFHLPHYMAIRFNLRIQHVHRGLLLGTGPLVDPGFEGRLMIPLHNLTSDDYELTGGEGFIWVEFTKLSPNKKWNNECDRESDFFREFPEEKMNMTAVKYLQKASPWKPIRSSIPEEVKNVKKTADESKEIVLKLEKDILTYKKIGIWATIIAVLAIIVPLGVSLYSLAHQVFSLVQDSSEYTRQATSNLENIKHEFITVQDDLKSDKEEIKLIRHELSELKERLNNYDRPSIEKTLKQDTNIIQPPQDVSFDDNYSQEDDCEKRGDGKMIRFFILKVSSSAK